jgi:FlaA1/EpsC-like NDP-sugar epimerase
MGEAVLAGTARAVRAALTSCDAWAAPEFDLSGAAILGSGDADLPTLRRAPRWDAFDFAGLAPRRLILAEPAAHGLEARIILERAAQARMKVLMIEPDRLRPLRLDDLVGRPLGEIDHERIRAMIADRRVLITGGGGSIGAQLARRLAALGPARLTLLDSSEYNLFRVDLELAAVPVLADVRDSAAMRRWFARERPELVFHAAALKQVPLVEAFPGEGVLTNVGGLRNVADAARDVGADFIFVSTDKAVAPSGVMGAWQ